MIASHVPRDDPHKERPKVSNVLTIDTRQFFNRKHSILLGQHTNFALDLVVHLLRTAEPLRHELIETSVDLRGQALAHGKNAGPLVGGSFVDGNVALHDAVEVGPVAANGLALDRDGVVKLLEGVCGEVGWERFDCFE